MTTKYRKAQQERDSANQRAKDIKIEISILKKENKKLRKWGESAALLLARFVELSDLPDCKDWAKTAKAATKLLTEDI